MRCLTLKDLPPPPPGKTGWPWTQESPQLLDVTPGASPWPRISIVTPSYNQAQFIEETIRSVLLQGYPNLEYIIIDGGSTDGSVEIIRKYKDYLAFWVSEKDNGQSQAINKGFANSSGAILGWINADDILKPKALRFVSENLKDLSKPAWLVGSTEIINSIGLSLSVRSPGDITRESILDWPKNWFPQQSTFWTKAMRDVVGPLDESLHYSMDFAIWLAMIEHSLPFTTKKILSSFRYQEDAKGLASTYKVYLSIIIILARYLKRIPNIKRLKTAIMSIVKAAVHCVWYFVTRHKPPYNK